MNARRHNWAAKTVVGRVRAHNEDSVLAQPPLFVVADGLGGHEAGEVASSIAVETLRDHAPRRADARALARAVKAANREVLRAAHEGIGRSGMGTTMTAAIVEGGRIAVAHVGDSRAYLLREGGLRRISEDHSMVADMIRRGQISEAESRVHPNRSVITRALGTDNAMEADIYELDSQAGDRMLLCSDGLTSMLEDDAIADLLGRYKDPEISAEALVEAANDAGGNDNISVVIVDIEEGGSPGGASRDWGRTLLSVFVWVLMAAVLAAGVAFGAYRYARSRYFAVADASGIATYRGVPGEIAGYSLSWPLGHYDLDIEALSPGTQKRLAEGVTADSREELDALVREYRSQAPSLEPTPPESP